MVPEKGLSNGCGVVVAMTFNSSSKCTSGRKIFEAILKRFYRNKLLV